MKLDAKKGIIILLIVLGAMVLLKWFIPVIGAVMGLLMPIIVLALGFYGLKRGKSMIGIVLIIIGALMFMGKASAYIGIIAAALLIYMGFAILNKNRKRKDVY